MKTPLLVLMLPAAVCAAPLQGFSASYQDWETVCDNTGTCRIAGYQSETGGGLPVSVLFTRKAGANAAVSGALALYPFDRNDKAVRIGKTAELRLNGRLLGNIRLDREDRGTFTPQQVQALLSALAKHSTITVKSGGNEWKLSDKGAAAAMLKADEFQQRLDTPSALIRKGKSAHAVLAPQPVPKIHGVRVPQKGRYELDIEDARYGSVLRLLQHSHKEDRNAGVDCSDLLDGYRDKPWGRVISIYPLNGRQVLAEAVCASGAYQSDNYYVVMDKKLSRVEQIVSAGYGGQGGFEAATSTLSGSFKGRGLGDCWGSDTAVWNGKTFVHFASSSSGMCRGFTGGAWDLPTKVGKVIYKK